MSSKLKNLINRLLAGLSYRSGFTLNKPINVILNLTNQCNLQCQNCDIWQNTDHSELTTEQWYKVIDDLSQWLGKTEITLNGGEIFLRKDILQIIGHLKKKKFLVAINTNGGMIAQEVAKELVEKDLYKIELSLYSLDSSIHDELRGVPGTWQKTSQAIEHLLKYKQELNKDFLPIVAFLINAKNYEEIPEMVEWATRKGIWVSLQPLDANFQVPGKMTGVGQWHKDNPLWPIDYNGFRSIWHQVIGQKKRKKNIYNRLKQLQLMEKYYLDPFWVNRLDCFAGQMNYIVNSDGQVYLCFRRAAVGSALDKKPADIWRGKEAKMMREEIGTCQLTCRLMNCNYRSKMVR